MSADLERKIGELTGHLDALVPTLERMERRQDEGQTKQAKTETELSHLKSESEAIHQDFRESFQRLANVERESGTNTAEVNTLKAQIPNCASKNWVRDIKAEVDKCAPKTDVDTIKNQLGGFATKEELKELKDAKKDSAAKWWDLAKLLIAAVLGGIVTAVVTFVMGGGG